MAQMQINMQCRSCSKEYSVPFNGIINVGSDPDLRARVASGEFFLHECPYCGAKNLIPAQNCLYHDALNKIMIVFSPLSLKMEDVPQDYTCRLVGSIGELIEKVKIFSASLDDVVIEMCKYVLRGELKKDVELKFVGISGADSEMTFTYPQNSQMEMIAVGFNVYEDCAGIVRRNPELHEAARGCVTVDKDWLKKFFA